jgi:hypothetical protein
MHNELLYTGQLSLSLSLSLCIYFFVDALLDRLPIRGYCCIGKPMLLNRVVIALPWTKLYTQTAIWSHMVRNPIKPNIQTPIRALIRNPEHNDLNAG